MTLEIKLTKKLLISQPGFLLIVKQLNGGVYLHAIFEILSVTFGFGIEKYCKILHTDPNTIPITIPIETSSRVQRVHV
jgi:hypothetical protein